LWEIGSLEIYKLTADMDRSGSAEDPARLDDGYETTGKARNSIISIKLITQCPRWMMYPVYDLPVHTR